MRFVCTIFVLAPWLILLTFGEGLAYEVVTVKDGGVVSGKVTLKGVSRPPRKMLITKDRPTCGDGYREIEEVRVSDSALRDVVVVLEGVARGKPWSIPEGGYVVDQKGCAFHPYVSVIPQGTELLILNSDPVLHNIHAYELIGRSNRTLFNVAQPKFKPRVTKTVQTTRGRVVRIECDAHNWMLGWLYVTDHPYSTVVGKDGTFMIDQIPPGRYVLKAWHSMLGTKETEINLSARGNVEVTFEFEPSQ